MCARARVCVIVVVVVVVVHLKYISLTKILFFYFIY